MRRFLSVLVVWAVALVPAQGAVGDLSVLAPADGFVTPQGRAWLVVRSSGVPRVALDGRRVLGAAEPEKGVYHVRVGPLRAAGSRLEVDAGGKRVVLTLYGARARGSSTFHAAAPKACWSCHEAGSTGCGECHRWPAASHAPAKRGECGSCHDPARPLPADVVLLCRRCHPKEAGGRHTGLRHPVSAPQDPARPGRPFDCTSCHEPHAPACLGRLAPEARRRWCRGCHRR